MTDTSTASAATSSTVDDGTASTTDKAATTTPAKPDVQDGPTLYTKEQFDGALGARLQRERDKLAETHAAEVQKARDEAKAEALNEVRFDRVTDKTETIAKDLKFHDAKDALAVIDKDKLLLDKDGKPDEAAIKKALEDLLKAKPYLAASDVRTPPKRDPKPATGAPAETSSGVIEKGRAAAALRAFGSTRHKG